MEGRSGAPQAATAALVRNTGVAEPDVAMAGGGSRRGAAASGGLVVMTTDQGKHGFGGATVPDLNMVPAGDSPACLSRSTLYLLSPSVVVIMIRSN
jgi:hypothetical protein